ncbi:acyl-CoA dehydratase activase [Candidatus Lokiarchaeum ossiferum]|uniref:acyl-CoA dehydratase activase n=1 Tax=Candidatus Lokiarchaeum ossiferum TaxID=2951803 RepID=UPI00352EAA71
MSHFNIGIDIGSTTAKTVIMDQDKNIIFSKYERHNAEIIPSLLVQLQAARQELGDIQISSTVTGSAGMGVSEKTGMNFVQEVVASAEVIRKLFPDVKTLIDLGGEDAKIIFFNEDMKPDIRMNGNCAGGTGAFIDQMASLLNVPITEINGLAEKAQHVYPVASRCGVFAKTDVQNLISRDVPAADIAASIYRAVAFQSINSLSRGFDVHPKVIFTGGPLTFQPELRKAFMEILKISDEDVQHFDSPELFPAIGACIHCKDENVKSLDELIALIQPNKNEKIVLDTRLERLFESEEEFETWLERKNQHSVKKVELSALSGQDVYLGIDSGSTTTKIVLVNELGQIGAQFYRNNNGNPIQAVVDGLTEIGNQINEQNLDIQIRSSAVTGYGEDLIHFALNLDAGIVETIAHFKAASFFDEEVSFIMDIGGQDMKAIFCEGKIINNLELNESCSSGCGSFIETFANGLGETVADFARAACYSEAPCDLGTRCTVFMNSKVKQSLREGATKGDISAGIAISVIKNCFNKVLKLTDLSILGDHIVVQGGTFKNPAVLRALENYLGKEVVRPNIAEHMGAYGAALVAKTNYQKSNKLSTFIGFDKLESALQYTRKSHQCKGCENTCTITKLTYPNGKAFYTGNKCESIYSNKLKGSYKGENLHKFKKQIIFDRPMEPQTPPLLTIGIPRALNMWEDFPFWCTLFVECGIKVVISDHSTMKLAEKGYGTVMSENICFPAKITNGHIMDLIEKKVDRIFYPMVRFNRTELDTSVNNYNCPIVTGYPEVIKSSINPAKNYGIPFDAIPFTFNLESMARKIAEEYLISLGVSEDVIGEAFHKAQQEWRNVKDEVAAKGREIVQDAQENDHLSILLLGRPYHVDSLVNHKIPELITALGVNVITEDAVPYDERSDISKVQVLSQWTFPNRLFDASIWVGENKNVELVYLNSFGCGPDAVAVDEVKPILNSFGKNPTVLRIDEISSPGSVKLRIRSLIESIKMRGSDYVQKKIPRVDTPTFEVEDKYRTILAPEFSPFYTRFITAGFELKGYKIINLPEPDRQSIDIGLKYTNNDICYPASIVIGDHIKALQTGKYDVNEVACGITQTGGQCRASSYAALLKKALVNAGFAQVPVVAVAASTNKPLNIQPGFQLSGVQFNYTAFFGIVFADALAKLYYRSAVREKNKGESWALVEKYIEKAFNHLKISHHGKVYRILKDAVKEFNQIEMDPTPLPRVGIVGEIYVKFNPFSNGYITDWLMERKVEVEVTPLITFFLKFLVNKPFNHEYNILPKSNKYLRAMAAGEKVAWHYINKANKIIKKFKLGISPIHPVRQVGEEAAKIMSVNHQYGEAWLVSGEIGTYVNDGIQDVVCLQPFGCIANHIVAKGVEKRLRELYPSLNLLFLDMDAGASEVNTANRLEFLIRGARESLEKQLKDEFVKATV